MNARDASVRHSIWHGYGELARVSLADAMLSVATKGSTA